MTRRYQQTAPLVAEAHRRGISVQPIPGLHEGFAMLEYRGHREFIVTTVTDRIGSVRARVLRNKASAIPLLEAAGFPVAPLTFTASVQEAGRFLAEHARVVVKPTNLSGGVGVSTNVTTLEELDAAMDLAAALANATSGEVVIQKQVEGHDYRILVVDQRHVFAVRRLPPFVIGDGERTIAGLVRTWNASLPLSYRRIRIDEGVRDHLEGQALTPSSVPADGVRVQLRGIANSSQGGFSQDVTDTLGESVRATAREVAATFAAPVLGIDVISTDIAQTLGFIIELNPDAGILLHEAPTIGQPRPIAPLIIDMLFPETAENG